MMYRFRSTHNTIWGKWNWWPIWEIARRRWSISSCRHIFALRQKVKKNHSVFFSSWHVLLPKLFFVRVCTSVVRLVWCGCVKIPLPSSSSYTFFFLLLVRSFLRLLFAFFFVHNQHQLLGAMTYGGRIYIHICKNMCVPFVRLYITRGFTLYIYPSEEIMLLCGQSNNFSSLSVITRGV
jgi:hypothetical protein